MTSGDRHHVPPIRVASRPCIHPMPPHLISATRILSSPSQATPALERWRTFRLPLVMEGDEPQRVKRRWSITFFRASRVILSRHSIEYHTNIYPWTWLFTRSGSSLSLASHPCLYSATRPRENPELPTTHTIHSGSAVALHALPRRMRHPCPS